jgi:methionyl-tRNA synthetase
MIELYFDGTPPSPLEGFVEADRLLRRAKELPGNVAARVHAFAFDRALDETWTFVADANRYVTEEAPWRLAKGAASQDREEASASAAKLHGTLFSLWTSLLTTRSASRRCSRTQPESYCRSLVKPTVPATERWKDAESRSVCCYFRRYDTASFRSGVSHDLSRMIRNGTRRDLRKTGYRRL